MKSLPNLRRELSQHIQNLQQQQLPFFLFRKAGSDQVRVLSQHDDQLHHSLSAEVASAVMAAFHPDKAAVMIHGQEEAYFNWELQQKSASALKVNAQVFEFDQDRERHVNLVSAAVQSLNDTGLKKVVLSRKQIINTDLDQVEILENLLDSYPQANCYFFYHPKHSSWMGASPEVLLSMNQNQLTTMSLAGTALHEEGVAHHWGDKELEEQQLVTDFIASKLLEAGATKIEIAPVQTVVAGSLLHLRSDIKARIKPKALDRYLKALHPTPAVCGLPRTDAFNYILENETYDRSFYTGYFGIREAQSQPVDFYVNLRCMRVKNRKAEIFVGGGITAKSNALEEYKETLNKLKTMAALLG